MVSRIRDAQYPCTSRLGSGSAALPTEKENKAGELVRVHARSTTSCKNIPQDSRRVKPGPAGSGPPYL